MNSKLKTNKDIEITGMNKLSIFSIILIGTLIFIIFIGTVFQSGWNLIINVVFSTIVFLIFVCIIVLSMKYRKVIIGTDVIQYRVNQKKKFEVKWSEIVDLDVMKTLEGIVHTIRLKTKDNKFSIDTIKFSQKKRDQISYWINHKLNSLRDK